MRLLRHTTCFLIIPLCFLSGCQNLKPAPEAETVPVSEKQSVPVESKIREGFDAKHCSAEWCTARVSYYGHKDGLNGQKTASGEKFNAQDATAAHKTLPFGTKVRIKNPSNGKEAVVRINDRGPNVAGRDFDLSHSVALQLDLVREGTAIVQVKIEK